MTTTKTLKLYAPKATKRGLPTQVEFGVLHKNDCVNFGICKISRSEIEDTDLFTEPSLAGEQSFKKCRTALAYCSFPQPNQFQIDFLTASMCAKARKKYFANNFFVMDEDFHLPEEIFKACLEKSGFLSFAVEVKAIVLLKPFIISKGIYRVFGKDNFRTILFPTSTKSNLLF